MTEECCEAFNNKTIEELHNLPLYLKFHNGTNPSDSWRYQSAWKAINAFVTIAEDQALAPAKGIDRLESMWQCPFRIPLAVKDNISTDGILTTSASKMLYNYEPIFDAAAVANAKSKGIVFVGKTNMDEFAMGSSGETSYYSAAKNTWDHSKVRWFI